MIKNYIKIAFRNLTRNKLFALINISGLTIGMVSFVLIMLYVNYEQSFDRFYPNADRIYRVYMDYLEGDEYEAGDAQTYNLSGPTLKKQFPEIENFVRVYALGNTSIVYNNSAYQTEYGHVVDSMYFDVFGSSVTQGDINYALQKPNSMVITEQLAAKIFKDKNPVGEIVELYNGDSKTIATITGVIEDIPENTHIQTEFLVSFDTGEKWKVGRWDLNWDNNNFFTFILLNKGVNASQFKNKVMTFDDGIQNERHNIEPLTNIHLHSHKPYEVAENGSVSRVRFLLAIAVIIMVLSWFNFVNLSISKAMERALETGVRKASGASKRQLIGQFLMESSLINSISIMVGVFLVVLLIPIFNQFTGKGLIIGILSKQFYVALFGFIAFGSFVSGMFPALVLSKVNPSLVLKGKNRRKTVNSFSQKALVTMQIAATIVLMVATIAINKQIRFIQQQPLGFNSQQVVALSGDIFSNENIHAKYQTLKSELDKLPGVNSTAFGQTYPGEGFINMSTSIGFNYPDGTFNERGTLYHYGINEDYIPLLEYKLIAGRNYEPHDNQKPVLIINEELANRMGYKRIDEIIGETFKLWGRNYEIIGVVENNHHFGLKAANKMMIYQYQSNILGGLLVRLNKSDFSSTQKALNQINGAWNAVFPNSIFKYTFINERFNEQFNEDKKFNKAFGVFTFLAIVIASLGLFGLGTQICAQRIKEIGVRKVNGAKIIEVIAMLNKQFVEWVVIAFIIALPLSYYILHKWLESFSEKTTLSWWIFALGGFLALCIALVTVSWHTFKAAYRNPVESLRYE